jgi:hypothetical protein
LLGYSLVTIHYQRAVGGRRVLEPLVWRHAKRGDRIVTDLTVRLLVLALRLSLEGLR